MLKIPDNPLVNDERIPSPPTPVGDDAGAATCCGRYCDGEPIMGREAGRRSPG